MSEMDGRDKDKKDHILIIGEKESFLIRVLFNKLSGAGFDYAFAPMDISSIADKWEGTELVTLYLDKDGQIKSEILSFLDDMLTDSGRQMIAIANEEQLSKIKDSLHRSLLYQTFVRPLDAQMYLDAVSEFHSKLAAGEYRKSILVVDDDPTYLGLVREWLRDTYKVAVVTSGLQAIKWLGKNKADLILLDHEMPVTSGPKVLEMLRSDNDTKDIPVMFLTGKSDKESVMQVVALKPQGYLLKNIEREELLEKIGDFFIRNMRTDQ